MRALTYFIGPDTGDTLVKTGETFIKSIVISWKDFTADEFLTLVDGTTIAGSDKLVIYYDATGGTITHNFAGEGLEFQDGLFVNKGATASGKVAITLQYR